MKIFFTKLSILRTLVVLILLMSLTGCDEKEDWLTLNIANNSQAAMDVKVKQKIWNYDTGVYDYPERSFSNVKPGESVRYDGDSGDTQFTIIQGYSKFYFPRGGGIENYKEMDGDCVFTFDGSSIKEGGKTGL